MPSRCLSRRRFAGAQVAALVIACASMLVALLALLSARGAHARALASESQAAQALSWKPRVGQAMLLSQQHFVQAHHSALANNWELASHELDEIEGALLLASNVIDDADRAQFIEQMRAFVGSSLRPLRSASEAKNAEAWNDAIAVAAKGCNACHATFDHSYVRVRVPPKGLESLGALDYGQVP